MLNDWKMKFITDKGDPSGKDHGKALLIEGEACVDFPEQSGDFCRSIRDLERDYAHVEIDLNIEKATARFKIRIPPKKLYQAQRFSPVESAARETDSPKGETTGWSPPSFSTIMPAVVTLREAALERTND